VPSNRQALVLAAKSAAPYARPGLKAIAGSFEERREQVAEAIRLANPDAWWTYIIATFTDTVVFEVEGRHRTERFEADYQIADNGDITLANVRVVDVVEVVQPTETPEDPLEDKATAPAPASPRADITQAQVAARLAEVDALLIT
jgi:hypothetical protein